MRQETYEKAKQLEERINHITSVIAKINKYEYKLEPPTRQSNYYIRCNSTEDFCLNEGEVVFLRNALEKEKNRLCQEFVML